MNNAGNWVKIRSAVLPAFLLAVSVGQIYAFTNFSDEIVKQIGGGSLSFDGMALSALLSFLFKDLNMAVQFAFSLGIFFLGMGAAFFGKIVEKNIRLSTIIGTTLFISGLCVTALGVTAKSIWTVFLGYGFLLGLGTGIIYISPVKTMMMWFPQHKAIAAAFPIISFGLGSTLSTIVAEKSMFAMRFLGFREYFGVESNPSALSSVFFAFAVFYLVPMAIASMMLRKPKVEQMSFAHGLPQCEFSYLNLLCDSYFWQAWIFMFLNISCGLCLIPLAKQMMHTDLVGYPDKLITAIIALCGLMNGGGRFLFAWWSDRLARRVNILLFILGISAGIMTLSYWPAMIGIALLVINACYGAGFSVIPAIISDHFGMTNISKIHGAVLSAWGFAGIIGNQVAMRVNGSCERIFGENAGYYGVVTMLVALYLLNMVNALILGRRR